MTQPSKPHRLTRRTILLPLLALLLACMPRLATAQETLPDPAQQVLTLVNQTRANNGLGQKKQTLGLDSLVPPNTSDYFLLHWRP